MAIEVSKKPLKRRLFEHDISQEQKERYLEITLIKHKIPNYPAVKVEEKPVHVEKQSTPVQISRRSTPLSERQQLALLRQLTKDEKSDESDESKSCQSSAEKSSIPRHVLKRNKKGETRLHLATIRRDITEVKYLLRHGVNVDSRDFAGWTALHEACNIGELNIATFLLKSGADVNALGFDKFTPLHDASANGHEEVVRLLLEHGANPNTKNAQWKTPLDLAGTESVAQILREVSCDIDLGFQTCKDQTPKQSARWQSSFVSPYYTTGDPCDLTMKNNSSHKHKGLGADKPTSPRLTLRFQSIKSRNDKNTKSPKVNNFSPDQTKYTSYCVTMEDKGNISKPPDDDSSLVPVQTPYKLSPKNCAEVSSDQPKPNNEKFKEIQGSESPSVEGTLNVNEPMEVQAADNKSEEQVNGDKKMVVDVVVKEREYSSDTEKEERRCKRRKSSDGVYSRRSSIGSGSGIKRDKSLSSKAHVQNGQPDITKSSPKSKKKSGNSGSDTESNSSNLEILPPAENLGPLAGTNNVHNGTTLTVTLQSLKVPPLKIVIPSGTNSLEPETRERSKLALTKTPLPYVVNTSESTTSRGSFDAGSDSSIVSGDAEKAADSTKSKDDNQPYEERVQRVTRSSQRIQAALSSSASVSTDNSSHLSNAGSQKGDSSGESMNEEHTFMNPHNVHPRKWKLRARESYMESDATTSGLLPEVPHPGVPQPSSPSLNSYQLYLNIRKQVNKRRKSMFVVHPEPPHGFKDYLLNRCSYVLEGNAASRLSVPMIPPPQSLEGSIKDLFVQQEKERYRLRLQHLIEREKLVLSAEQEMIRVHARAARALANQTVPLSVCSILKDEEIYNVLDVEQEEKDKNVRSRYNSRLFLSWLQDVDDKWEKIKGAMLLRHHNEAESLHAVQKLDWEWKLKELAMCDMKTTPVIDDISVPIVRVNDDFELLPA